MVVVVNVVVPDVVNVDVPVMVGDVEAVVEPVCVAVVVMVVVVVNDVVAVDVGVTVLVVVGDEVMVDVGVSVLVMVGVLVPVELRSERVGVLVAVVVPVVVGEVTSQFWNPPVAKLCITPLSDTAIAAASLLSTRSTAPMQSISAGSPSGPRNAVMAAPIDIAICGHVSAPSSLTSTSGNPS